MHFDKNRQHGADVHRLGLGPGQFRIQARGIGYVADQPVQADDVLLDNGHHLALLFRVFQPRRGFHRAPQRRQGVLDLVRHVGGETFDGVHPDPQGNGHFRQALRQIADFVVSAGEVGNRLLTAVVTAHQLRGDGEAPDRADDGAGQIYRQQHRHPQGDGENLQDIQTHLQKRVVDGLRSPGQHQHPEHVFVALHRNGDAENQAVAPGASYHARPFAQKRLDGFRVVAGVLAGLFTVDLEDFLARQAAYEPVIDLQNGGQNPAFGARGR